MFKGSLGNLSYVFTVDIYGHNMYIYIYIIYVYIYIYSIYIYMSICIES